MRSSLETGQSEGRRIERQTLLKRLWLKQGFFQLKAEIRVFFNTREEKSRFFFFKILEII